MTNLNKFCLIFILIIALAAVLRFYNITAISLWHDEAFSALLIKYSWNEMIYRIGLDVHPAFYYIILKLWYYVFGDSLLSLRGFSAFGGVLTVWGVYFLTKEVFNRKRLALLAALFVAINPFQIAYGGEARMYTFGTFLIVFASYFLIKALNSSNLKHWFYYALFLAASFHIHYYLLFSIFAHIVYAFFFFVKKNGASAKKWLKDRNLFSFIGAFFFSGILFLPWLSWFLYQIRQVEEQYWIPKMTFLSVPGTFYKMITSGDIYQFILGQDPAFEKYKYVAAFFFAVGILAIIYFLVKIRSFQKWLIFFMLLIPFLLAISMSLKTSVYLDRYFVFASVFYLIILSAAIFCIPNKKIAVLLTLIFLIASCGSFIYNWKILNIKNKPGMGGAAKYISENAKRNDKILVGSSFVFFTFRYYNQTGIEPLLFVPGGLPHFSGSALLASKNDSKKLENTFKDFGGAAKKGDTVYALWTTGFGANKPAEIPLTWRELEEKGFEDVYGYRGWIVATKYLVP